MKKQMWTARHQQHTRFRFAGLIISLVGITVFLFLVGGAFAASGPSMPSQKQQLLQQMDQQRMLARGHAKPKNQVSRVPSQTLVTPQAGITQTRQGPFPPSFFQVQSLWQGPLGNTWVLAYAGAKPYPDGTVQQGAILLYTTSRNASGAFDLHPIGMFLAPNETTALTIVSVNGSVLQLRAGNGDNLTFDLQTHQYRT